MNGKEDNKEVCSSNLALYYSNILQVKDTYWPGSNNLIGFKEIWYAFLFLFTKISITFI